MNARFCMRMALTNLNKNKRLYAPYTLSAIGMAAMFYIVLFLYRNKGLEGSGSVAHLREMMFFGSIITGIFVVIFLLYTNSFVIKQRAAQFGLYAILGLEKRHTGKIMLAESAMLCSVCVVGGLAAGILLSKAMLLLLLRILGVEVTFGFEVPPLAVGVTAALFAGVFALSFIWNVCRVNMAQPVQLLNAGRAGEREPRVQWLSAAVGALCLGGGYALAQRNINPLAALPMFFIAALLVIAGTYLTFTAGSIALLKALRRNKRFYYRTRNFISVSGMIYRMKQNAAGLASICVLFTSVLVVLSTTVSMYTGMEDVLRTRFPRHFSVQAQDVTPQRAAALDEAIALGLQNAGLEARNTLYRRYRFFLLARGADGALLGSGQAYEQNLNVVWQDFIALLCVPLSDYNAAQGGAAALGPDEALVYYSGGPYTAQSIAIGGAAFTVRGITDDPYAGDAVSRSMELYYLVVPDDAVGRIAGALGETLPESGALTYSRSFDIDADAEAHVALAAALREAIRATAPGAYVESAEAAREDMLATYGGLLFLGIFLGSLFVIATVLIIYYKQVSEGRHDRTRFAIMQQVGLTRAEVRAAIRSQVLTVFYLPPVMSVIHIIAAHKVTTKLLALLNLTNTALFAACTLIIIAVFTCFYAAVYAVTARTYYRIVGE